MLQCENFKCSSLQCSSSFWGIRKQFLYPYSIKRIQYSHRTQSSLLETACNFSMKASQHFRLNVWMNRILGDWFILTIVFPIQSFSKIFIWICTSQIASPNIWDRNSWECLENLQKLQQNIGLLFSRGTTLNKAISTKL